MPPEESMEFVRTLNQGVAGETLYYTNRNGKRVFAGYVKGRLSMIVFQRHSKVPIVYRGYRRARQGYDDDQASVRQNQMAINEAYNKNKMLKKKVPKSVAVGNRYESLKRKLAHSGQSMTRLVNRKQSSSEVAAAVRRRNIMVANKTNPYERHNGFTQKESRIAMAEREKQVDRLRIIKSSKAVASMLNVIKNAPLEASVVNIKDLGTTTPISVRRR